MYISIDQLYQYYLQCKSITTDTRQCEQGAMFFALKGANFNGNKFAVQALEAGCSFVVIDEAEYQLDDRCLLVDDVLTTLQALANHHRNQLSIPVLGITGTNGKTTTKELVKAVLDKKYNTLATEGNLNNHIGVPLTLLKIKPEHEFAIIEMGANHPGEIGFLSRIAAPNFGLITNIGKAHLEGFGSFQGVIKTKLELYNWLREHQATAFVCADNALLTDNLLGLNAIFYAEHKIASTRGKTLQANPAIEVAVTQDEQEVVIQTQLVGTYNLPNILAATSVGSYFGVSLELIKQALEQYEPQNKRSQLIQTEANTLILDAYNANPTSMVAALENFASLTLPNKTVILGDMRELGESSLEEHQNIIQWLLNHPQLQVYLVGDQFKQVNQQLMAFDTTKDLLEHLEQHPICNATILIKGSRGIALEKVTQTL